MNVVITGSTKGIGLGMAREFVQRGHNVMVSSRSAGAVSRAIAELEAMHGGGVRGCAADVSNPADVRRLWEQAAAAFGTVDIWINNAGMTNRRANLQALPDEQIAAVVGTNLLGLLNCCKVAICGMLAQGGGKAGGKIFNMEGFGSDGLSQPGMSVYGATKYAVRYLTKSLVKENKDTPLVIGYMSPGIVVTDLLTRDLYEPGSAEFEQRRRFLNILADRVETVAPFLVQGALDARKSGVAVRWMTPAQALPRLVKSFFVKRDLFAKAEPQS
jgi:NAD(P)-dependent dehydrogenase (short-subunit alcohol dehydrogenase family)